MFQSHFHWGVAMKRTTLLIPILIVALTACGGNTPAPTSTPDAPATSSVPTSTPQIAAASLPVGTLLLRQLNNPLAQPPNAPPISIPETRIGSNASPNARYGVRLVQNGSTYNMQLVDFSSGNEASTDIPQGAGLTGPTITWKEDSTGFAFYDFPMPGASNPRRMIYYYDVASGQTSEMIAPTTDGQLAPISLGFSPDGKYLMYALVNTMVEGVNGSETQTFLLDVATRQATPRPEAEFFAQQWVRDESGATVGFVAYDPADLASSRLVSFRLDGSGRAELTPAGFADLLIDASPDGRRLVVTSAPVDDEAAVVNIYSMDMDGTNRRQLTQFAEGEQTVIALVWSFDGIYYSLSGTGEEALDITYRMSLDGTEVTEVAQGRLEAVITAQ
jgi:Tol biopolymer transport system component